MGHNVQLDCREVVRQGSVVSVLVTGAAGFIGFHVSRALALRGETVFGVDNLNDRYSPELKKARLHELEQLPEFTFSCADVAKPGGLDGSVGRAEIETVIHLAAQAGVRYADTHAQVRDNLLGQIELLEFCRRRSVSHFMHASSSAVYGGNTKLPYVETDRVDDPLSVYAATKRGGELLSRAYSFQHGIPVTSLRFFTTYGPWGRPDMAPWIFTEAILAGRLIRLHSFGGMRRSFTYIDDLVVGILAAHDRCPAMDKLGLRHATYNLGNPASIDLEQFVSILEVVIGRKATRKLVAGVPGEMSVTEANIRAAQTELGFQIRTSTEEGLQRFVDWFLRYRDRVGRNA